MFTLLFATLACTQADKDSSDTAKPADSGDADSGTDSGSGDSGNRDSGADSGDDSAADSGTSDACGGDPSCALEVEDESAECGSNQSGDPTHIMAAEMRPGEIQVTVVNAVGGCCPNGVTVTAEMTPATSTIDLAWKLGEDPCHCYCMLDIGATLPEVPAGTWTIRAEGYEATVESSGPN